MKRSLYSVAWILLLSSLVAAVAYCESAPPPRASLAVGVVQLAHEPTLSENRDKIVRLIGEARAKGCRVAVFPEGALWGVKQDAPTAEIDTAIAAVCEAAKKNEIYVVFCAMYKRFDGDKPFNWLLVVDPSGQIIHRYHKLWSDNRSNEVPGIFMIDGIPCAGIICADRWIRGVEDLPAVAGAKILFELSCNFADEWVPDLGWYWYEPRALRNNVFVVLSNTAPNPAFPDDPSLHNRHGHTCILAPDGTFLAAADKEPDRILTATLDMAKASGDAARQRRSHPLFRAFWETGVGIMQGGAADVPSFSGHKSPAAKITIAAAQMACSHNIADNVARMKRMIGEAQTNGATVVVFPELAVTGARSDDVAAATPAALESALRDLQSAAPGIHVVFGMPFGNGEKRQNCAVVVGPEGNVLTRHAQIVVDRPDLFAPGTATQSMWFRVNGVPAVVTIGHREALWSEIAELAAVRGAQLHFHICYDTDTTTRGVWLRRQLWANLASFRTFTATVNAAAPDSPAQSSSPAAGGSMIWEDFRRGRKATPLGYGHYCAIALARAGAGEQILYATQTVSPSNPHFGSMTGKTNPQMTDWYEMGAQVIDAPGPLPVPAISRK